jgi:hypothetical protein
MYKKKLLLCALGYAERKIPSGENQNHYLVMPNLQFGSGEYKHL